MEFTEKTSGTVATVRTALQAAFATRSKEAATPRERAATEAALGAATGALANSDATAQATVTAQAHVTDRMVCVYVDVTVVPPADPATTVADAPADEAGDAGDDAE